MKYTFEKFQIQLVSKPIPPSNPTFIRNDKRNSAVSNNFYSKALNIKTTELTHRSKIQKQDDVLRKSLDKQTRLDTQKSHGFIKRSQSLKSDANDRYKSWLNSSSLTSSLKQKQYNIFKEKCIDLLSKKKVPSQMDKSPDRYQSTKPKISIGQNQQQLMDQNPQSVEQMMNNIIEKFKSDSRRRNYDHKQIKKNQSASKRCEEKQTFFTINNFHEQNDANSNIQKKQTMLEIFKSVEFKKNNAALRNKSHNAFRRLKQSQQANQEQSVSPQNKNVLNIHSLLKNMNLLTCTSLALNSASREMNRNALDIEHIKLSPYPSMTRSFSSSSKRKKIHLNKPSMVKKFMKFTKNTSDQQYNKKIKAYLDFLFKLNFSNGIYVSLQLASLDDTINFTNSRYKVYVGPGNNSLLIKSLLKRRGWIDVVDNIREEGIQFYWTQNKINQVHEKQQDSVSKIIVRLPVQKVNSMKRSNSVKINPDSGEYNSKILPSHKCEEVESYIFADGYEVPFAMENEGNIVTNHIPNNSVIGSKKNLFKLLLSYYINIAKKDPFAVIPKTYHIKSSQDPEFKRFIQENSKQSTKLWILKPGENTNRGNGIRLSPFSKIKKLIKQKMKHPNGHIMTYIVQSYINRPFLYNGRKFDIRHYMLVTSVNGNLKSYWYRDGYIRTSSQMYDLQDYENEFVHLTNDAIQLKSESYGQYEDANKLSYTEFQRYLDYSFPAKGYNFDNIVKEMRSVVTDVVKASYLNLDKNRKRDNFQLFGFDFMIDHNFKPYLIQINFNPCLVVNCNLLNRIIPPLIENTLRVGLDPLLPPKSHLPVNKRHSLSDNYLKNLRYELIFDESSLDADIYHKPDLDDSEDEEEQEYGDNGKQVPDNFTF